MAGTGNSSMGTIADVTMPYTVFNNLKTSFSNESNVMSVECLLYMTLSHSMIYYYYDYDYYLTTHAGTVSASQTDLWFILPLWQ